jgi:hypothetical protein
MASAPLIDLLAKEADAIRGLTNEQLAEFLTDLQDTGWDWARETLGRYRKKQQTIGEEWR